MSRMLTPRIKGDSETVTVRSRSQRAELLLQRETRPSHCPSAPVSCHTGPSLGNMPASGPLPLHRPPPATSVAPSSCGRLVMVTQATPPPRRAFSHCHGSWCAVLTVRVISGHGCDPKSPVWLPPDEARGHEPGPCPLSLRRPIWKTGLMLIGFYGSKETQEVAHRMHSVSPRSAQY